ncbi:MAG: succinate dehydrogenase (or fumarate reductase) cytochrome b subunit, b558 family [Ferruginibacter sp.]|nr:succinate dehydrogenase (or fumarate reductase) cytochrome b subunit, b558 family [Ferruginibacter sp.]
MQNCDVFLRTNYLNNICFMTWKQLFTSSLGKKFTMAFTGFFLILFLIVHVTINACIFLNDGGQTYNTVAHFMSHNWIVRFLEIGLFAGLILHIIQGLVLWKQNRDARPIKYYSNKPEKNSTWYSRSMGLLGTLLLLFLVMHLSHFYVGTKVALYGGDQPHNLYNEMRETFSYWWIVAAYIIGVIALFWHLMHGFQSAFQSLGLNHKRYRPIIQAAGLGYTVIICVLFILMPLAFYFNWLA